MGRIRYLQPGFFKDEDLVEHPFWIRILFEGLWTIADKEGRLEDRPKRIKAEIFPYESVNIEKGLCELAKIKNHSKRPFIQRYEINGEPYIQIINWHKHQKPHHTEKDSIIPEPPPINTKDKGDGDGECVASNTELSNGVLTVKLTNLDTPILYLNEKAKTNYDPKNKANQELVRARFLEGRTIEQFKIVVDRKVSEWLTDEKMHKYLRPSTLFSRTHFEEYLNEPIRKPQSLLDKYEVHK